MKHMKSAIHQLHALLSDIDYERLPISEYNRQYIGRLKPALAYYLNIYSYGITEGLRENQLPLSAITLVDFGGGSGFLSMLAKETGIGRVIYVDLNENSVNTIRLLKEITGIGPDIILHGSSDTLSVWCKEHQIRPEVLIATDLIEHVYDLRILFKELTGVNDRMKMIFTTASTPFNPYVKRRLHRFMDDCEYGSAETPNYVTKRFNYIKKRFPDWKEETVQQWAVQTRGLVYADIEKAIRENKPPLTDAHNTCDPETGNWTERILPVKAYRSLLSACGYDVSIRKGFYNSMRPEKWKSSACQLVNFLIRHTGKAGFLIAPFIMLSCVVDDIDS